MKKIITLIGCLFLIINFLRAETTDDNKSFLPVPFLAIAQSPGRLAFPNGALSPQTVNGMMYRGGFGGFVSTKTGLAGYPGYNSHAKLEIGYDDSGLLLMLTVPYPYRGTPANDDIFEILIDPRDKNGTSSGNIYRIKGNAQNQLQADFDEPDIGQFRREWNNNIKHSTLFFDSRRYWQMAVYIPFKDLGGKPEDGCKWGIQCAFRYPALGVNATLASTAKFDDSRRFAEIRFDRESHANFILHGLNAKMLKKSGLQVNSRYSNPGSKNATVTMKAQIMQKGAPIKEAQVPFEVKPNTTRKDYFGRFIIKQKTPPANDESWFVLITAVDSTSNIELYRQYLPFRQVLFDEQKDLAAKLNTEFKFFTGPYPSYNIVDIKVDARTLKANYPDDLTAEIRIERNQREVFNNKFKISPDGELFKSINLNEKKQWMPEGKYTVEVKIFDKNNKIINAKKDSFTRKIMPFEIEAEAGIEDIIPEPFIKPEIDRNQVKCVLRTYKHSTNGLFAGIIADSKNLLSAPARLLVKKQGGNDYIFMSGSAPELTYQGKGKIKLKQTFSGGGLTVQLNGTMDYDGFYLFDLSYGPETNSDEVTISEFFLEIPFKAEHAFLYETAKTNSSIWANISPKDIPVGKLPQKQGIIWDSITAKKFYLGGERCRKNNLAPYLWLGDDYRGMVWSMASARGTNNSNQKPSATISREGNQVVFRNWFVNKPLKLKNEKEVKFAILATPFKPMPKNWRLWRGASKSNLPYANGVAISSPHIYDGLYNCYGRFITVKALKEALDKIREKSNYDILSLAGSSCSECGGTPEYQQFWYEWGSPINWIKQNLPQEIPAKYKKKYEPFGISPNPFVMVEAKSNACDSNIRYRSWWFKQAVKYCGAGAIYQDNPPHQFRFQPVVGYGYINQGGVNEPENAIWQDREFQKRVANILAENGVKNTPNSYHHTSGNLNIPGGAFSRRVFLGEFSRSDKLPLDVLRIWLSKQWGWSVNWLCQGSDAVASRKYWRNLFSKLLLLDVMDFTPNYLAKQWLLTMDIFRLDAQDLKWHPYYRQNPVKSNSDLIKISYYTQKGKAVFVISNQSNKPVVERIDISKLAVNCGFFYDVESLEKINLKENKLQLYLPPNSYRLIIGFSTPWEYSAEKLFSKNYPAQSELDRQDTVNRISKLLLNNWKIKQPEESHFITVDWIKEIIGEITVEKDCFKFFSKKYFASKLPEMYREIKISALVKYKKSDKKEIKCILMNYYNPSKHGKIYREDIRKKLVQIIVNRPVKYVYVLDALYGYTYSHSALDLPSQSGRLELYYWDYIDYHKTKEPKGPCKIGNSLFYLKKALDKR
jgi:hypothetical protein